MTDPNEIGRFTCETISPILQRAQKQLTAKGQKTQLKPPHGDQVKQGEDIYVVDIGRTLYLIPSEKYIKIEFVPEKDLVTVSTQDNPLGKEFPFDDNVADYIASQVGSIVQELLSQ